MGKVSIIMPAYNAERYIAKAIQSVNEQTFTDWELIVIDDASQDRTAEIVQEFSKQDLRILFYQNIQNSGVSATRNRGLDIASGDYIAFLDSDDLWMKQKLEKQLCAIQSADLCYTAYQPIDLCGTALGPPYLVPLTITYRDLLCENVIGCSSVLLRTEALKNLSMDLGFVHEDYELWLRLLKNNKKAVGLPEPMMHYRTGGRSHKKLQAAKNRWIVYRKAAKLSFLKACGYFVIYMYKGCVKYSQIKMNELILLGWKRKVTP